MLIKIILMFIIAYLLGGLNFSILLSKLIAKKDIRELGSGNAGFTNTLRNFGKGTAALVLIGDALKAVVAILIARYLSSDQYMVFAAGLGAILGHNFPVYYGFKGGKGILTSAAVVFMIDPRAGLFLVVTCVSVMFITRYVSVGSILGCIAFPVSIYILNPTNTPLFIFALLVSGLALFMHRENIKRLINGTENRFGRKKNV